MDTAVAICRQHQLLNNKENELYSSANDPRPRPQVIPNMDRTWSPTETASDPQNGPQIIPDRDRKWSPNDAASDP